MDLKKVIVTMCSAILMICFSSVPGFSQAKKGETMSFSGVIQGVSKDNKSIIVDEKNYSISQDTKIVDQNGNAMKLEDIGVDAKVAIEAIPHRNGLQIKRIRVKRERPV